MKSLKDSCCRKHFNVEWMWGLVTNRQQIKRFGFTSLLFLKHYKHQMAPEPQSCCVCFLKFYQFFALPLTLFFWVDPFLIFLILFHHFIFMFCLLSVLIPCTYSPRVLSLTTSCSSSHPPLCFVLPCFLALLILCTCAVSKEQRWVTLWEIPSLLSSLW